MKIAIVGSGIAGLTAAYYLHPLHQITLFEAAPKLGGHSNTVTVDLAERKIPVDTGFIVFNDWTYPNFISLMDEIGIHGKATEMSFSVKDEQRDFEYNGHTLDTLFAQRRNLVRPSFWAMLRDIIRFNREARELFKSDRDDLSLGDFLKKKKYCKLFCDHYIIPMGAAIWSTSDEQMLDFPIKYFARFFENHGLLNVVNRPQWLTIPGGSQEYVKKLSSSFQDRIRLNAPVMSIRRQPHFVEIFSPAGRECFDEVVLACHSNQALQLLQDATSQEREILGAISYQKNEAVLHQDISLLPKRRKAWASWNYHLDKLKGDVVAVTYNMNILQHIPTPPHLLVTLNRTEKINPDKILSKIDYEHPIYTQASVKAQKRHREISGLNKTHFCGAYWRNGFHEDGVVSAKNMLELIGIRKAA
jgi:predicted NAD/FAD-binding protein